MRRVVFVLASGVAFVLALGAGFLDSNVGIAKAKKCPPGTTYEKPFGLCTITKVGSPGNDLLVGSKDPRITTKMYGLGGNDLMYGYRGGDGMSGGRGQDILYGGGRGDGLFGDSGRDMIYGGPGAEEVWDIGGAGVGGGGQDIIATGAGSDYIESNDGERDIISCGPGYDWVLAEKIDHLKKDCEPPPGLPAIYWWTVIMGEGP